jgi:4-amino-4-deoxy-L-arabinose transferase-like glycosyltransferase
MRRQIILLSTALVLAALIWLMPWPLLRYSLGFVLLWVLPGLSWVLLVPRQALDRAERLAIGLGLNFVITPLVTLLLVYLPGSATRIAFLGATVGTVGLPAIVSTVIYVRHRKATVQEGQRADDSVLARPRWPGLQALWRDGWAWLLVALLIAAGLRVVNLDYAEFGGDEARVMMYAARALEGDEAVVFQHSKGPAELTVVMVGWRLTGMTSEWMARLPFAWASVLGVATVFLCVRRLGRPHAGGVAACLLAIEGFLVGFGRIVQYQSLVFALSALGLLCLLVYRAHGRGSLVIVAAAFFAGGILAHYDAALVLPAGLLLIAVRLWQDRQRGWRVWVPVVAAALIGVMLPGLFYIPLLRGPHAGETSYYVLGRIGSGSYNHLWSTFQLSAVYDAVYLLAVMALVWAGQVFVTWARWGYVGLGLAIVLVALAVTGLIWPQFWVVSDQTLVWIPFAALLVGSVLAPGQPASIRALWLWLGLPSLLYLFFVAVPLTHVHTAFPAWAVLTGLGLANLGHWLAKRSKTAAGIALSSGVALYILCGTYAFMLFVVHNPEYLRNFPQFKSPIYWTPYEQKPIEIGLYGFPYRVGWKVVGALFDRGYLAGSYSSNEKPRATAYYTRQAVRLDCASPDMYIVASDVHDAVPLRWDQIKDEYHPAIIITVGGQPKLTVYEKGAVDTPAVYPAEEWSQQFDLSTTPERVAALASSVGGEVHTEEYASREALIGGFAYLLGYKVDDTHTVPGGYLELTLLWQAQGPAPIDYQVFTHLHDGQVMRGQLDGQPVCSTWPTSQWEAGQLIADPYRIPINSDAALGSVPLTIGMYDLVTMKRLPVTAPDGAPAGDSVYLTDVEIREP